MLQMLNVVCDVSEKSFMLWGFGCLNGGQQGGATAGGLSLLTNGLENPLLDVRPLGESLIKDRA